MCSIAEDDFGDKGAVHEMIPEPLPDLNLPDEICKKCEVHKVAVKLNFKEAQCQECFFIYVRHKFRAALGSTKLVPRGANVMLVYDGGSESSMLLDVIQYALFQETFKRLHIVPYVLYVDDNCLLDLTKQQSMEKLTEIKELLTQFKFNTYYTSIAVTNGDVVNIDDILDNNKLIEQKEAFLKIFNSMKSLSTRQDFIHIRKTNIIRQCAKQLNCKYVFLSDIGSDLAKTFLTNIALGRGSSVGKDVSFSDPRTNVTIIRPIRDLTNNEVYNYIKLREIKCIVNFKYGSTSEPHESIQNLTKSFVDSLQTNFSSTISTIFKTGDKMNATVRGTNVNTQEKNKSHVCLFCHSDLDYENSTTLFAIEYSRYVSANIGEIPTNTIDLIEERTRNAVNGLLDKEHKTQYLCHGCRNIFKDSQDGNNFLFDGL